MCCPHIISLIFVPFQIEGNDYSFGNVGKGKNVRAKKEEKKGAKAKKKLIKKSNKETEEEEQKDDDFISGEVEMTIMMRIVRFKETDELKKDCFDIFFFPD